MPMDVPEDEPREVPAYMVSFGDMITLLLTFILLVALADTQMAGLVGAGRGPLIKHVNAEGRPGVMSGRLSERRLNNKADSWWIPDQEGDPDELERVEQKLLQELQLHFSAQEADISYEDDRLILRLPARINYDNGRASLDQGVEATMTVVADQLQQNSERRVRINGDVPRGSVFRCHC